MTGPRDYAPEWAAVFAAEYTRVWRSLGAPLTEDDQDVAARCAAQVADEAVRALHRVRGQEGA